MYNTEHKIITLDSLERAWPMLYREFSDMHLVTTNGTFDLMHPGHINTFEKAHEYGEVLIVLVNSDASVKRYKGPSRPINNERDRALMVSALHVVDFVIIFDEDTPCEALEVIRPDFHVKGGDWKKEDCPEAAVVEKYGGEFISVPVLEGYSTTNIIDKIRSVYSDNS